MPAEAPARKHTQKMNALQTALVVGLLTDHFDKETSTYREGHSDSSLAARSGVSDISVRHVRLKHFGKINRRIPDEDLEALRRRVHNLESLIVRLTEFANHACNELGFKQFDFSGEY